MLEPIQRHKVLLDVLLVAVGASLVVLASRLGLEVGHPIAKGPGTVLGALYILYLGILFLLSYYFPDLCYVLAFLRYVCEAWSRPAGRGTAWFYFALSLALGSYCLLVGLGAL